MTARSNLSFAAASRVWRAVALVLTIVGALAIATTHFTFSNTKEEPAHIAAGAHWLAGHRAYDERHPPLGRIAAAIGPWLHGERPSSIASSSDDGARILGRGPHYRLTLALARLGELPFFFVLCAVVWAWGRRLMDERGAAIAVFLTVANPNVLAHAGLATPDIALAAMVVAALFAFVLSLETRHWLAAVALGTAVGLAATADFSAIPMLAVALPAVYALHRATRAAPRGEVESRGLARLRVGLTIGTAVVVMWAIYGFDTGRLVDGSSIVLPAPAWFRGFAAFLTDSSVAHPAFLFGERSANGWWYYYPIALLVKTPLPLLLFAVLGAAVAIRRVSSGAGDGSALALVSVLAIVTAATTEGDDSGVRLVLPIFPLLALLASAAAVELWDDGARRPPARRLVRATVAAVLVGAAIVPIRVHPDHLAYFNPFAGDRPELVLVDSNLDWGQDLYRLGAVMKRMHIDSLSVAYYGSASFDAAGVRNARPLAAAERPRGWIAASQTMIAGVGGDGAYEWLTELQPVGRVGSSLVLYYVPPRRPR